MFEAFNHLSEGYQGLIYITVGTMVMLYALGIFGKGITVVVVLFSLYLVWVGLMKIGLLRKINKTLAEIHHKR
jgi:hypothetical protein